MLREIFDILKISVCLLILTCAAACSHNRQVVPYETDIDKVLEAVAPNEDSSPENPSFGPDSLPGYILDYEITTPLDDVYIYFDPLTVLDVKPEINADIFSFVGDQLSEFGFIADSVAFQPKELREAFGNGRPYRDVTSELINRIHTDFNSRLDEIEGYKCPFNAHFQIYPLYFGEGVVTYRLSSYCYTGGAHGLNVTYIRSYDLNSGNVLTFNDIVKPESQTDVREEIAARMAYFYPIYENITTVEQYIDSLNAWLDNFNSDNSTPITLRDFPVPDVALTREGLAAVYQMYELTPGSDGCPIVVIPYKDIEGCLQYSVNRSRPGRTQQQ